jgi:hypothetical protein
MKRNPSDELQVLFSAKSYYAFPGIKNNSGEQGYEQRIVVLFAKDEDEALRFSEQEAMIYAKQVGGKFLGFIEVYKMFSPIIDPQGITEVYSLTMYDAQDEQEFLDNYYLTGGNARVV